MDGKKYLQSFNHKIADKIIKKFFPETKSVKELTGKDAVGGHGKLKNRILDRTAKKFNDWDKAPSKAYFAELFRVSKNQVIFGGNYFDLPPVRGFIIWDKCQPFPNFSAHESKSIKTKSRTTSSRIKTNSDT